MLYSVLFTKLLISKIPSVIVLFFLFLGVPGVLPDRFREGMQIKHCALSLVGMKYSSLY